MAEIGGVVMDEHGLDGASGGEIEVTDLASLKGDLLDTIEAARKFYTGQRVIESHTGRSQVGSVSPRLIGYPPEYVPVEFDGSPMRIVGVLPEYLTVLPEHLAAPPEIPDGVDLDLLAYDIADLLDRGGYGMGEITQNEIRRALPDFLRTCLAAATSTDPQEPDPLADVKLDQVISWMVTETGDCPGIFAGERRAWYCTRDRHPEHWQHVATDLGNRVLAIGMGSKATAEVDRRGRVG